MSSNKSVQAAQRRRAGPPEPQRSNGPTTSINSAQVFSKQGHSGHSASMVVDIFKKLASYKPLQPLTGEDSEWVNVEGPDGNMYQNNRNFAVFKDSKDGKAYFSNAYVKRTPNGSRWGGQLYLKDGRSVGRCYIRDFSNMPTIFYRINFGN